MAERAAHLSAEAAPGAGQAPSIFEVLAKDSLTSGLRPALKHLVRYAAANNPERFSGVLKWYDEAYLALETLLENYYLNNYSATFSENFYGMKRVAAATGEFLNRPQRLKSLLFVVFVPYLKMRLDQLHENLKEKYGSETSSKANSRQDQLIRAFIAAYPWLKTGLELWTLLLQLGYILSKSSIHFPWLWFSGARLEKLTPADLAKLYSVLPGLPPNSNLLAKLSYGLKLLGRGFFVALSKTLGVGLFFLQFLDWWFSSEKAPDPRALTRLAPPPAPQTVLKESQVLKMDPQMCPICKNKRRNDTVLSVSGYLFCYSCIFHYLNQNHCCPVTKLPAGSEQLIRIFHQPS